MHTITFESLFYFDDLVEFSSAYNGSGRGTISDIVICKDKSIYYIIQIEDGDLIGGILPHEVRVLKSK